MNMITVFQVFVMFVLLKKKNNNVNNNKQLKQSVCNGKFVIDFHPFIRIIILNCMQYTIILFLNKK